MQESSPTTSPPKRRSRYLMPNGEPTFSRLTVKGLSDEAMVALAISAEENMRYPQQEAARLLTVGLRAEGRLTTEPAK